MLRDMYVYTRIYVVFTCNFELVLHRYQQISRLAYNRVAAGITTLPPTSPRLNITTGVKNHVCFSAQRLIRGNTQKRKQAIPICIWTACRWNGNYSAFYRWLSITGLLTDRFLTRLIGFLTLRLAKDFASNWQYNIILFIIYNLCIIIILFYHIMNLITFFVINWLALYDIQSSTELPTASH